MQAVKKLLKAPRDYDEQTVHSSPQDKGPICPVPQSTDQKDYHRIDISAQITFSVPAQRNVKILGEKSCECDMPSFSEVIDRQRLVW